MAVRNEAKTIPLRDAITARLQPGRGSVTIAILDLDDLESVKAFAGAYIATHTSLDLLINNAGVFIPSVYKPTKQGLDVHMGPNHFAHFALTTHLLPPLMATSGSRVVTVSSQAYGRMTSAEDFKRNLDSSESYDAWSGYARSKLANILFTFELKRRLEKAGKSSPAMLVVHPGFTATSAQSTGKSLPKRMLLGFASALAAQSPAMGCSFTSTESYVPLPS